jgi:peroxiredoxin
VTLFSLALWAWPLRRADDAGPHHGHHALDAFERAGVTELTEGQRGPGLRLHRFPEGGPVDLVQFQDKLVVLNFWATWCTPCTVEMPALEALWTEYRHRGLLVVGVAEDRDAPSAVLAPYLRTLGLTFPVLVDPDQRAAQAWRVSALPTTFLVRPGGEVVGIAVGAREWNGQEMRALLETLLPRAARDGGYPAAGGAEASPLSADARARNRRAPRVLAGRVSEPADARSVLHERRDSPRCEAAPAPASHVVRITSSTSEREETASC